MVTGIDPVRVCVGYRIDGASTGEVPASAALLERVEPVYEEHPGWDEDISTASRLEDLPANARRYIDALENLVDVPVGIVSVGPARDQTLTLSGAFD